MANSLFRKKPLELLLKEMAGKNRLRRVLGPLQLTSLGVGATIGTWAALESIVVDTGPEFRGRALAALDRTESSPPATHRAGNCPR